MTGDRSKGHLGRNGCTTSDVPPASLELSIVRSPSSAALLFFPGAIAELSPIRPSVRRQAPDSSKQELRSSDFKYPSRLPSRAA